MALLKNYKCDCCGKVVEGKEFPKSWWEVQLTPPLEFNTDFEGSYDVCWECLGMPLRSSGLKAMLLRVIARVKRNKS